MHKSSIAIAKGKLGHGRQHSAEVAIQTEREVFHMDNTNITVNILLKVEVENSLGIGVVSPGNRKFDLLSSDPLFFLACDDHARLVSQKWYKNLKKLVRHLLEVIDTSEEYKERRDLISVRLIFVWICENIRYDPAFQEHQVKKMQKSSQL